MGRLKTSLTGRIASASGWKQTHRDVRCPATGACFRDVRCRTTSEVCFFFGRGGCYSTSCWFQTAVKSLADLHNTAVHHWVQPLDVGLDWWLLFQQAVKLLIHWEERKTFGITKLKKKTKHLNYIWHVYPRRFCYFFQYLWPLTQSGLIQRGLAGRALQDLFNLSISAINATTLPVVGRVVLLWVLFCVCSMCWEHSLHKWTYSEQ